MHWSVVAAFTALALGLSAVVEHIRSKNKGRAVRDTVLLIFTCVAGSFAALQNSARLEECNQKQDVCNKRQDDCNNGQRDCNKRLDDLRKEIREAQPLEKQLPVLPGTRVSTPATETQPDAPPEPEAAVHVDFDADAWQASQNDASPGAARQRQASAAIAEEAVPLYRADCDAGDIRACHALARFLALTHPPDAVPLYERACAAQYAWSCQNLGTLYFDASKLGPDFAKAAEYYGKGCALSDGAGRWSNANRDAIKLACHDLEVARRRERETNP